MRLSKKWNFILVPVIFLLACSGKKIPSDIIQPDEMKRIVWDIVRAQSLTDQLIIKDTSIKKAAAIKVLSKKIFDIHHTTELEFNKSYAWYTQNPNVLRIMMDSLFAQNQRDNRPSYIPSTNPRTIKLNQLKKRINASE